MRTEREQQPVQENAKPKEDQPTLHTGSSTILREKFIQGLRKLGMWISLEKNYINLFEGRVGSARISKDIAEINAVEKHEKVLYL